MYTSFIADLCSPSLSFSQAWRDLTRQGESRAGDAGVQSKDPNTCAKKKKFIGFQPF